MEDFIHLHVHTYYSILDGQSKISKLVDKAIANGMRGMAVTDHGDMFGIKEFFDYCVGINGKRQKDGLEPFKPIFGCEMYVARNGPKEQKNGKEDQGGYHLIVLAKNYQGYKNLIKLVSRSWTDGYYMRPRTDHADLERYHEGLIVCSACIAGEVPKKILNGDIEGARKSIEWHKRVFGDDYYLELQRHEVKNPAQRANRETFPMQQQANKVLIELAHEYGIKLVCTNDVHFVDEENAEAHDHLLCLATAKDLDDPTRMLYSKQEWFKTREEMNAIFSDVPEALSNTLEILDKVEFYSLDHDPIMPFCPIPEEFGTEEQWRQKFTEEDLFREFTSDENGENPLSREEGEKKIKKLGGYDKLYRIKFEADYLAKLAYEGAHRRYGVAPPTAPEGASIAASETIVAPSGAEGGASEVLDRIRFELHIMKTMGFPGYFLIVQDFINSARDELGVMVGPGRGSAAGSVVAYCLGITKIDPLKYDLLFERFLNPDRISLPDIDTDFDDDGRGRVLKWVEDKYGHENCAHIITYASMATKNSIKDVARVEKLPLAISNALCKAIPDRLPDVDGKTPKMNLTNAIKAVPELRDAEASNDPVLANTIKYAKMLEGTVRGTGIHACGFIICRDPISDWVPVSTADDPDFKDTKTNCTQYDGHVIESTGLIKMDFLGLKTLSELKEACANIKLTRGIDVDLDTIPIDDAKTYELYQQGRTVGTFQFESAGMQKYLRELKPTVFEDLIAMNALYRPGPMGYIPQFIRRKHGEEPITYDIPVMEKYLKDTYGITVYQEQVMLLSRLLADFTRGESDALRKAMGKKKKDIVDKMKPKFIDGGKKNGHDPKVLDKIWGDWEAFASYAFNKSHAACYSWVAYQTAYLKANYPAEFMAAIMSRRRDQITEITKLMDECKQMGIATLGPDVNESYQKFGVNHKGEIRFGLAAIKGMGDSAAQAIIDEREQNGPYKSIFDFAQRVSFANVNRKAYESLALSGGFDSFGIRREQFFAENAKGEPFLDTLVRYGQMYQQEKQEAQNSLFGGFDDGIEIATPPIPKTDIRWSDIERLNKERDLVGIYLSAHPLDEYKIVLDNLCNTKCVELADLQQLKDRDDVVLGGIVTAVRTGFTKTGKPFGIVTLEDFEGSGELALFGEDWGVRSGYFSIGSSVYVTGKMKPRFQFKEDSPLDLKVTGVEYLQTIKEKAIDRITIQLTTDLLDEQIVADLGQLVSEHPGKTKLFFQLRDSNGKRHVLLRSKNSTVDVRHQLIDYIERTEALDYKIN